MSNIHTGNVLNEILGEEHDGLLNAKKTSLLSAATIYAVVNTSTPGIGQSIVTIANTPLETSLKGNVTIDSGVITSITNPVSIAAGSNYVGLATVDIGSIPSVTVTATDLDIRDISSATDSIAATQSGTWDIGTLTTITNPVALKGNITIDSGNITLKGNVTIDSGTVSVDSNTAWSDPNTYIGLVTVGHTVAVSSTDLDIRDLTSVSDSVAAVQSGTWNVGTVTTLTSVTNPIAIKGNLTLSDPKGYIGLVSVASVTGRVSIAGNVTVNVGSLIALRGNVTIQDGGNSITVDNGGTFAVQSTLQTGSNVIGKLADSNTYIGLVTASSVNNGTSKTLIPKTIALTTASIATIAVPTNTFYITQLLVNSTATARVSIKSGATYLTGNASVGITLNPGGGWVESGSPDSPLYDGLADAASIVVEKLDLTGTSANIAGKIIYFEE